MSYIRNEEGYVYSNGEEIVCMGLSDKGLLYIIEKHFECIDDKLKEFIIKRLQKRLSE